MAERVSGALPAHHASDCLNHPYLINTFAVDLAEPSFAHCPGVIPQKSKRHMLID